MTLTEFLTARFAEDEAPTWTLVPYPCPPDCCAPAGWVGSLCRYCDATPVYGGTPDAMAQDAEDHAEKVHQRSRVLADVAARRKILAQIESTRAEIRGVVPGGSGRLSLLHGLDMIEHLLAQPYHDEPGWDPAWKIKA